MIFTLKSGRTVYANNGIIGLGEPVSGFEVTEGYDGIITWPPYNDPPEPDDLTADDMREIADMMIDRWTRFRASLPDST